MARFPRIRVNTSVPFPSLVIGSGPITVTKQNGIWTVGIDLTQVPPLVLPPASLTALGGVVAVNPVTHQWVNSINTGGVPLLSQPAFSDISGTAAAAQLIYTQPLTGAVQRQVAAKIAEYVSVDDFGAVGDGTTDDLVAINAAITAVTALGGTVIFGPKTYRLSAGIRLPDFTTLLGTSFYPQNNVAVSGTVLKFDLSVATCLSLGTGGTSNPICVKGISVTRAAGAIPAGSVGVLVDRAGEVSLQDVQSSRHAQGFKFSGAGLGCMSTRLFTGVITDAHLVFTNSWAEARFSECRFGLNGVGDVNCTAYVRVTGGTAGVGTNTLDFVNCQFDQGQNTVTNWFELVSITGTLGAQQLFKFTSCHIEAYNFAVRHDGSGPTIGILNRLVIAGCTFNNTLNDFWSLVTPLWINEVMIADSFIFQPFTLNVGGTGIISPLQCDSVYFDLAASITGASDATAIFSGCQFHGNLTLAGAWNGLFIDGTFKTGGTFANTATGSVKVNLNLIGLIDYDNAPVTVTTSATVTPVQNNIICNGAGTITLTLPAAATYPGMVKRIKTIAAQLVVSATSNVVPVGSATAGTAILAATIGKWAELVSDGTNWVIMEAN